MANPSHFHNIKIFIYLSLQKKSIYTQDYYWRMYGIILNWDKIVREPTHHFISIFYIYLYSI